jgi:hypothetical protein
MTLDRAMLRSAYDTAIDEIDRSRGRPQLTNSFYAKIGDSIFDACYRALGDAATATSDLSAPQRLHVVSAPMGTGKTSFSVAFIVAMTRLAETNPELPFGCVFLVEQRTKADEMYCDLNELLPGKVAVWTSDHDVKCSKPTKVIKPSARFDVEDLQRYPVVVATHAFYKGVRSRKVKYVTRGGDHQSPRALTVIDEQSNDVLVYDVTHAQAAKALDVVQGLEETEIVAPKLTALVDFMWSRHKAPELGSLEKPTDAPDAWTVSPDLYWFAGPDAEMFVRAYKCHFPGLEAVFGFAKSLANGYAFVTRNGTLARFVGYESRAAVVPGMVLLDATADIDGITPLCPWREPVPLPRARYDNLRIVHTPSFSKKNVSVFLKLIKNRVDYVAWMVETIKAHMEPCQRGLVVCKKVLFDNQDVPNWPKGDPRFAEASAVTHEYVWDIEGRSLCATYWGGYGVGSNAWKDADVVFLFDEHYLPKRIVIATGQALLGHKATSGPLSGMKTLNARSPQIDSLQEGHLLRWTKQMALRGNGRSFDEHGVCGVQKLVCTGKLERLLANANSLFPGAKFTRVHPKDSKGHHTKAQALIDLLSDPYQPNKITTKQISDHVGAPWREWGTAVRELDYFQKMVANLGWKYGSQAGRGGSWFERTDPGALKFAA